MRTVNEHRACQNFTSEYISRDYWHQFTILDCIVYIYQLWKEFSGTTVNRSWLKTVPELAMNSRKGSSSYEDNVQSTEKTEVLEMVMPGNDVLFVQEEVLLRKLLNNEPTQDGE